MQTSRRHHLQLLWLPALVVACGSAAPTDAESSSLDQTPNLSNNQAPEEPGTHAASTMEGGTHPGDSALPGTDEPESEPVELLELESTSGAALLETYDTWAVVDLAPADCAPLGAIAKAQDFSVDRVTQAPSAHVLELDPGSISRYVTTYVTSDDNHQHEVVFEVDALLALQNGKAVVLQALPGGSLRCPHIHNVTVRPCAGITQP